MSHQIVSTSKFLSFVLRHHPESIGLSLDEAGWARVDELIDCAARHGRALDIGLIERVVAENNKRRFALDEDRSRIRASQGHSVKVDLGLVPRVPPDRLYHGSATRFMESNLAEGHCPRGRQHVHLSPDRETAEAVGRRHGKLVVFAVESGAMAEAGHSFYLSDNGVWLVDEVPARFLAPLAS